MQSADRNAFGVQHADLVIEPDVTAFELTAFTRTDELAAVGEKTTLVAIPIIKEELARLDGHSFQPTNMRCASVYGVHLERNATH